MLAITDEELLEECFTALGMAVTGPHLASAGQIAGAASSQQGTASVSPVSKLQDPTAEGKKLALPTTQLYPEVTAFKVARCKQKDGAHWLMRMISLPQEIPITVCVCCFSNLGPE